MEAIGYFAKSECMPRGEYQRTSVDDYKASVDFLIIQTGNRYAISFNKPVELKESRSVKRANCGGHVYYVTERALDKLKQAYSWSCDF